MKVLRMVRNLVLLVLGVILCAILALAFLGWQMYTQALEATPLDQKVKQVRAQESYTTFAELPETYVDAVIAAEDHRFYQHNGIDVIAIGRAVVNDVKAMSFVEGGSTITQQLAKNLYFTQEKRLTRKVAEMFMAFHIEANYTKEEIFELYVNSVFLSDRNFRVFPNFFTEYPPARCRRSGIRCNEHPSGLSDCPRLNPDSSELPGAVHNS